MLDTVSGEISEYRMLIGGKWCDAASGSRMKSENPYKGNVWASVPDGAAADIDRAVKAARAAFEGEWGAMSARDRGKLMRRLGDLIADNAQHLATVESTDNGKLYREMLAQAKYLPEWLYYFAGAADKFGGEVVPSERSNFHIYTRHEPIGVVGAITPWNSPILLLGFKLAPALAAGCTIVVKPSEHTPASTLELAKLFEAAGFPPGVFNVVTGGPAAGAALSAHPGVDKLSFTGSDTTGKHVLKAGADNFTRVTLELGGKSPNIVFADADIEAAANGVIAGIFGATGQTCMAGSRLIVQTSIKDELLNRVIARASTIKMGDPMDATTEMGPMATRPQFDKVMGILERAKATGATFVLGGGASPDHEGFFIQPTIVDDAAPDAEVVRDEIFGPVLSVLTFETEDDAVRIANDTRFGLAAGVWTQSGQRGTRVAHRLRAGTVWINAYRVVAPNVPFGGFGHSGIGRENGFDAIRQYTETKAVWTELTGATRDPFNIG
ncbi:aldehyde dehydrogenase [Agrobacterium tumefaciens]|uniref:aldehyde dehydrogenase n=1 Tax=Agrobacterium tumefaciens TaxID=358 RepID=UPI0012B963AF|nr:aldehyde dehydrogenase [Agrobacterium tumefaciens]MQB07984.1 aldehyde dehydrogenase [Agrobacterium tumefaciens]